MNPTEAAAALASVEATKQRLAAHARWPFARHAMFGAMEGLVVAGIAQPGKGGSGMVMVGMALFTYCVMDDRRRHGMFVSGWQKGATRPLMVGLMLFVGAMLALAAMVRDGRFTQPPGFILGIVTFAVCTAASLWWERIYRAELARGGQA